MQFPLLHSETYELMNNTISLKKIFPVIERIHELTNLVPEDENIGGETIDSFERIDFEGVSYSYDGSGKALQDVSFTLKNKELVAFIGHSGSGKSTVMKLISQMYSNYSGKILLNGKNIDEFSRVDLRNNINLITQETELFNDTILNNILLDKEVSIDKVEEVCRLVNMHDTIMSFPRQYNTVINERINLSGGEKQRIAIARALINEKAIVIMDEPTSALDKANIGYIDDVIKSLAQKSLVILITHDYDLIKDCEHVIVMSDGRVERQGSYDEFINDGVIVPSEEDYEMELEAN